MSELKNILKKGKFVKGIILLILAIMGNYTGELLSCKVRTLLTESMLMKHTVTFFILYFVVDFTSATPMHPSHILITALLVYICFLMFNKLNIIFTIIVFLLFATVYTLTTYSIYYHDLDNKEKYKYRVDKIDNILNILKYLLVIILVIGFLTYLREQYIGHSKNWSTIKFLLGTVKCKSIK